MNAAEPRRTQNSRAGRAIERNPLTTFSARSSSRAPLSRFAAELME